jgi:cytochrome c biogenesis protein CcmG/thiol:disulfide interchange protein DsbE
VADGPTGQPDPQLAARDEGLAARDEGLAAPDEPGAPGRSPELEPDRPGFRHERPRHGIIGPFRGRQLIAAFVAVLVVAVALIAVTTPLGQIGATGPGDPRPTAYVLQSPPSEGLRPGDIAPELGFTRDDGSAFQLTDLDGRAVRLDALRGRAVWINFWASWCPPCQAETPVLRQVAERYADRGLTVIGISVQETSLDDVRAYAARYGLGYTVAADLQADVFGRYRVYALPTQFFIGPGGIIDTVVQGPVDEARATQIIESILPAAAR